ncbi:uncharacterized protein L201_002763 [Kwoniella dendrophila CBS 6074]|uniref:Uncharacterized protein n=1 Tax=Kwoniella dendrophila CBS 6074 TaxID=1295534 RepID=A0AAX4JR25_9TREE
MLVNWFLRGPASAHMLGERGGGGQGITTTRPASISYGTGPPASTETKWRGIGNEPKIAGSTGGFIGLISGIAVFLVLSTFIGIFLWNRYRRRLPAKNRKSHRNSINPLPSLSFSRPSTSDPYAQPSAQDFDMSMNDDEVDIGLDPGETPKASKFNFTRPVYARQRSSEWEIPTNTSSTSNVNDGNIDLGGRGKGKGKGWIDVELPNQPDEVALPLRTKSPSLVNPAPNPHSRTNSTTSISSTVSTPSKTRDKNRGKAGSLEVSSNADTGRMINPFENPYDETRLSPRPSRRQDSMSSLNSVDSNQPRLDARNLEERSSSRSSGGEDSDRSVRVSQIRDGTRFVERFESKESLA